LRSTIHISYVVCILFMVLNLELGSNVESSHFKVIKKFYLSEVLSMKLIRLALYLDWCPCVTHLVAFSVFEKMQSTSTHRLYQCSSIYVFDIY